jgi:hypothetical protein
MHFPERVRKLLEVGVKISLFRIQFGGPDLEMEIDRGGYRGAERPNWKDHPKEGGRADASKLDVKS